MSDRFTVGLVGARGHTGAEIVRLMRDHPSLELVYAGSRELAGQSVPGLDGMIYESIEPTDVSNLETDVVILALPDGAAASFLEAVTADEIIVDISFDHRLDDAWAYGLPELRRDRLKGATRIANPGCYATAIELVLAPLTDMISGVPVVFGVSGYSGAGSTPGPRNDLERLEDNLMPYKLVGHNHEREASHQLGMPIRFMPHVHQAFRGLIVTANVPLSDETSSEEIRSRFEEAYGTEPLIELQEGIPELKDGTNRLGVLIGGFNTSEDGHHAVVVAALDNLLKGAAVQALQNVNLALGLPELAGIV
jgi:N-acetyl-gamma-glutamyl-phosphate reductase